MKVYYGLTNYSQLKHMPEDIRVMVSARFLIRMPVNGKAFAYLRRYKGVFLDSGAFGCAMFDGGYTYSTTEYGELVERVMPEKWAVMDFPCEPDILSGISTRERIEMTIENTKSLWDLSVPGIVPIIQGWTIDDYLYSAERMEAENLIKPVMGIGSLCRRGSQSYIVRIVSELRNRLSAVKFHAFGVKISALKYNNGEILNYLDSIDTAAWQFKKESGPDKRPKRCSDYPRLFSDYSQKLNQKIDSPYQLVLK